MFTTDSKAIIYGLQLSAAQHMLDFDFLSERSPSVSTFINPGKAEAIHKLFYGNTEILIPSYPDFQSIPNHISNEVDTLVNFASFRSAGSSSLEAMDTGIFQNIIIIAEGIPERQTLHIIEKNTKLGLNIIGPATVGAMSAGVFRAGNTGGSLENIVASGLYKPGSVGFVSKSGGMSNELRRVIADRTNGTGLSIALGGDKYNIMDFPSAMQILEADSSVKMIVMLGEIGGRDELRVAEMIQSGDITKPVVAWCIGTINEHISGEVQFGHAGAKSNMQEETASYKNAELKKAGAIVPESYMDFGDKIQEVFSSLTHTTSPITHTVQHSSVISTTSSSIIPTSPATPVPPVIPANASFSQNSDSVSQENSIIPQEIQKKLSQIQARKKTSFTSTISDERGEELLYNGTKIREFTQSPDIGRVIGNLWLKRELPEYACKFINTVIVLIADHGPAVSGAHNAIVTARAGNDLKSSLIAGLTTVGPRFGGAIDGAGNYWLRSVTSGVSAQDFVEEMKRKGENIPGIGHKVKSKFNPDARCAVLEELAQDFPTCKHLDFAKSVEALTLEKKSNLILNVDGYIAAMLLDIFDDIGMNRKEKQMYVASGIFNGLFLLARTIGFIGHAIDQKRLGEGLYRTPWDDILYTD